MAHPDPAYSEIGWLEFCIWFTLTGLVGISGSLLFFLWRLHG